MGILQVKIVFRELPITPGAKAARQDQPDGFQNG
jgi:hypothetical protein